MILVTGCLGFIGTQLCYTLLHHGYDVLGIDMLPDTHNPIKHPGYTYARCDLRRADEVEILFKRHSFGTIIHLAALSGVRQSVQHPLAYFQTNVSATLNLLERIKHTNKNVRFILASSSSVYGSSCQLPFHETCDMLQPLSPYAVSKRTAELYCQSYHMQYGLNMTILRFFTVYGPGLRRDMAIFKFIDSISHGQPIELTQDASRDFIYIDDVVSAIIAATKAQSSYETINIGSGKATTMHDVVSYHFKSLKRHAPITLHPCPPYEMKATRADIAKAKRLLRWKPSVSFPDGLRRTIAWYHQSFS